MKRRYRSPRGILFEARRILRTNLQLLDELEGYPAMQARVAIMQAAEVLEATRKDLPR